MYAFGDSKQQTANSQGRVSDALLFVLGCLLCAASAA